MRSTGVRARQRRKPPRRESRKLPVCGISGKIACPDVGEAAVSAVGMARRTGVDPSLYDCFVCYWCGRWHVGHSRWKKREGAGHAAPTTHD